MRYYSTQRPVAPGTFPKPDGNKVVQIVNFDERQYCEEASHSCWGYIEYEKPLSEKQAADYELVREQLLDFKQRYMVGAGTSILRTFATAAELNEWFDAQIVENRHFCRLYDRERMVHILGCRYMWLKIEFIEKERYYDDSAFTGQCWMYPTFMVKDGIEYFMWNRREPDDSWKIKEREGQKAELLANKGSHFHFHGIYADPFEMLAEIERRGHTFTEPDNLFVDCRETGGFVDFHGNRNEASAAFHYRIYDNALVERIRTAVAPIIERGRKR